MKRKLSNVFPSTNTRAPVQTDRQKHTHTRASVHTYTHTHSRTQKHTYTHTQMLANELSSMVQDFRTTCHPLLLHLNLLRLFLLPFLSCILCDQVCRHLQWNLPSCSALGGYRSLLLAFFFLPLFLSSIFHSSVFLHPSMRIHSS